jgi:hypothetical protein
VPPKQTEKSRKQSAKTLPIEIYNPTWVPFLQLKLDKHKPGDNLKSLP